MWNESESESRHESEEKPSNEGMNIICYNSDFRIVLRTTYASFPIYRWVRKKELDPVAIEENTHLLSTFSWRITQTNRSRWTNS
jgi:hypothetical protein